MAGGGEHNAESAAAVRGLRRHLCSATLEHAPHTAERMTGRPATPGPARLAASFAAAWASGSHGGSADLTPREAYFRPRRTVEARAAIGLRSADLICPYPPGIPVLVPGEVISAEAFAQLEQMKQAGCSLVGGADADLRTLAVLD